MTCDASLDFSIGQIVDDGLQLIHRQSGYRVPGSDLEPYLASSAKKSSRSYGTFDVPTKKRVFEFATICWPDGGGCPQIGLRAFVSSDRLMKRQAARMNRPSREIEDGTEADRRI